MNAHAARKPWRLVRAFEVRHACGHTVLLPSETPINQLAQVAGAECVECAVSLMSDE